MSECEGQSDKRLTTIVEEQRSTRLGSNNIANMTGKRPRGLTRTKSVSQLGSGATLEQEFSPLLENPKERLKPTIMEPGASPFSSPAPSPSPLCAPRVVIGFNPKPLAAHGLTIHSECAASTPSSAPCSPSFQSEKATSPRSALNSLFSRQRAQVSDGVGLGIVLRAPVVSALASEAVIKAGADHIAILVRDDDIDTQRSHVAHHVPVEQSRRHSHPIPTPGISPCHFTRPAPAMDNKQVIKSVSVRKGPHQVARPVPGWLQQDTRRDTFMLAPSVPVKSFIEETVAAALTASSHFLDECSFCKRHLPKDKDIFMYRGDKAFCSVECRSQQMLLDERTKHCSSSALHRRSFASPVSFVAAA